MRNHASSEKEILAREINETEAVLAEISGALGCICIIDPTETLADRVRHLGMIAVMQAANLKQLRASGTKSETERDIDELENWFRNQDN